MRERQAHATSAIRERVASYAATLQIDSSSHNFANVRYFSGNKYKDRNTAHLHSLISRHTKTNTSYYKCVAEKCAVKLSCKNEVNKPNGKHNYTLHKVKNDIKLIILEKRVKEAAADESNDKYEQSVLFNNITSNFRNITIPSGLKTSMKRSILYIRKKHHCTVARAVNRLKYAFPTYVV